jgi:hypothetical protein
LAVRFPVLERVQFWIVMIVTAATLSPTRFYVGSARGFDRRFFLFRLGLRVHRQQQRDNRKQNE